MFGITHMGFNRTENRSEQTTGQKNHITQTLQHTHTNWSHATLDDAEKLWGPGKVIRWLEHVADTHLSTC